MLTRIMGILFFVNLLGCVETNTNLSSKLNGLNFELISVVDIDGASVDFHEGFSYDFSAQSEDEESFSIKLPPIDCNSLSLVCEPEGSQFTCQQVTTLIACEAVTYSLPPYRFSTAIKVQLVDDELTITDLDGEITSTLKQIKD